MCREIVLKMKTIFKISIMTLAISVLTAVCANGQVSVTARAFAEVVESVSVRSNAVTSFEISNTPDLSSDMAAEGTFTHNNVNLGEVKISSGSNVGCNLIITPAKVSNESGDNFNFNPIASNSSIGDSNLKNGNQTIALTGSATLKQAQSSGNYQGTYSIIVAYN